MSVPARVSNATYNFLMPKLVEGVVTGMQGASYFLVRSKVGDFVGSWKGAQVEVPFKWSSNTNGGSFSGMDVLSSGAVDNSIKLTYDCKFYYQDSTLAKTDISLNQTTQQVADLVKRTIASDTNDHASRIATSFYADGTGNGGKDLFGLKGIVDDGTAVASIGGQSRSTYTALKSTKTASGGTMTLAMLYTLYDNATVGGMEPDVTLTTKTVRSLYNQLLTPNERYMFKMEARDALYMKTGVTQNGTLAFRDTPIIADEKCSSGLLFMLNSKSMEFDMLPSYAGAKKINYAVEEMDGTPNPEVPKGLGFFWTGWREGISQEAWTGRSIFAGAFIASNPRFNAQLTGVTAI